MTNPSARAQPSGLFERLARNGAAIDVAAAIAVGSTAVVFYLLDPSGITATVTAGGFVAIVATMPFRRRQLERRRRAQRS